MLANACIFQNAWIKIKYNDDDQQYTHFISDSPVKFKAKCRIIYCIASHVSLFKLLYSHLNKVHH